MHNHQGQRVPSHLDVPSSHSINSHSHHINCKRQSTTLQSEQTSPKYSTNPCQTHFHNKHTSTKPHNQKQSKSQSPPAEHKWNSKKTHELKQLLTEQNIDVAVIQETRLHPDTKTPQIPNYSFTRQDRPIPASAKLKTN